LKGEKKKGPADAWRWAGSVGEHSELLILRRGGERKNLQPGVASMIEEKKGANILITGEKKARTPFTTGRKGV